MSSETDFPRVEVSAVVLERAGMVLAEYNPKWEAFTLPMARLRRRLAAGGPVRESPLEAAVRAAAKALGRPLPPSRFPQPVELDAPPHAYLRGGRDQHTKRYSYHAFALRVSDMALRHAAGWHTLWMKPDDLLTHRPVSPTAVYLLQRLPEDLFAI